MNVPDVVRRRHRCAAPDGVEARFRHCRTVVMLSVRFGCHRHHFACPGDREERISSRFGSFCLLFCCYRPLRLTSL